MHCMHIQLLPALGPAHLNHAVNMFNHILFYFFTFIIIMPMYIPCVLSVVFSYYVAAMPMTRTCPRD